MTHQPAPAPDRGSLQTNAIVLIVLGALCGGMIPSVFGIISLVQLDSDPESARRMNKVGWICLVALLAISILAVVLYFVVFGLIMGVAFIPLLNGF